MPHHRTPTPPGRLGGDSPTWRDFVADDAKGRLAPEQAAALRVPETLDDWILTLIELKRATEANLADSRNTAMLASGTERRDAVRTHADISRRANHFLQALEDRLREAKALRLQREQRRRDGEQDMLARRVDALEGEVERLRSSLRTVAAEVAR